MINFSIDVRMIPAGLAVFFFELQKVLFERVKAQ
jgi:hypothetical protein